MIYQVTATMFFKDRDEASDFFHDCEVALPKATVVKLGQTDQECSRAVWDECHHDEQPPLPCEVILEIDNCPD